MLFESYHATNLILRVNDWPSFTIGNVHRMGLGKGFITQYQFAPISIRHLSNICGCHFYFYNAHGISIWLRIFFKRKMLPLLFQHAFLLRTILLASFTCWITNILTYYASITGPIYPAPQGDLPTGLPIITTVNY